VTSNRLALAGVVLRAGLNHFDQEAIVRRRLLLPSAAVLLLVLALPAFAAARTIHAASLASAPLAAPPRSNRLPAAPPLPLSTAVSPSSHIHLPVTLENPGTARLEEKPFWRRPHREGPQRGQGRSPASPERSDGRPALLVVLEPASEIA